MKFFENVRQDLVRYTSNGGFRRSFLVLLISHSFHLVLFYRFGVWLSKTPVIGSIFRVVFEYLIRILYASDISLRSKIGPGLIIMHGHDIVIGSDVVIGKNCKIFNGVTFGNKDTESTMNQQPHLGDGVIVGTGAKILGAVKLGDYVRVGANSVVINDVRSGEVVAGVPAKIISRSSAQSDV